MNSKKILITTLTSIFIVVALFITILFILLGMYNKYYYSNLLKSSYHKHSTPSDAEEKASSFIKPFGKVSFLLGNTKIKKRKCKTWEKLTFGLDLMRGDSLRIGTDSKVEITLQSGDNIIIKGFKKLRIDSSIIMLSHKSGVDENLSGSGKRGGKIARLTGKELKGKETTPVSAIRSNKPPKDDNKTKLKTRIGE
ncbi:hypothetical protein KAU34_00750 [candidate division WOR-3 bacterium]|nr:hypothetical protein [candidate division WOR-3 bacterium]